MKYHEGLPPKKEAEQVILKFKAMPKAVGCWNDEEQSFVVASLQCTLNNGKPYDSYFENEWVDDEEIVGYWEMP